jgi:hypothetical protein
LIRKRRYQNNSTKNKCFMKYLENIENFMLLNTAIYYSYFYKFPRFAEIRIK